MSGAPGAAGRMEHFSRGGSFAVDVAAIERELAALWAEAGAGGAAEEGAEPRPGGAVTRAILWNLVVRAGDPGTLEALRPAIDDLVSAVPARVLVLVEEPAAPPAPELEASISANCVLAPGGGKSVCSEEITIVGRGDGRDHFPSMASALMVPDVPTALWWPGPPPAGGTVAHDLLPLVDRFVIDTSGTNPESLGSLRALVHDAECDATDLEWLRLAPLRLLLASLFDSPEGPETLRAAGRITVSAGATGLAGAFLYLGWIASRLDLGPARREGPASGTILRWHAARPAAPTGAATAGEAGPARSDQAPGETDVTLEIQVGAGTPGLDGLLGTEIAAPGGAFGWHRIDAHHVRLHGPGLPDRIVTVHGRRDPQLVVAALGARGQDSLFDDALGWAARNGAAPSGDGGPADAAPDARDMPDI